MQLADLPSVTSSQMPLGLAGASAGTALARPGATAPTAKQDVQKGQPSPRWFQRSRYPALQSHAPSRASPGACARTASMRLPAPRQPEATRPEHLALAFLLL